MRQRLPKLIKLPFEAVLYPKGDILVDPLENPEYIYQVDQRCVFIDIQSMPNEGALERMYKWQTAGAMGNLRDISYMQNAPRQALKCPIEVKELSIAGLPLIQAHTKGYRSEYQDRMGLFHLPADIADRQYCYVVGLFDGHGPLEGGDQVAQYLSSADSGQAIALAMYEWAERLKKKWRQMSPSEAENGWHFLSLKLQSDIKKKIMQASHDKMSIIQAKSLALGLKNTLLQMSNKRQGVGSLFEAHVSSLEELDELLSSMQSLEGVGSTAVWAFFIPNKEIDEIDIWVVNIGDSWCGLVGSDKHYCLVDEAVPSKGAFYKGVELRGGWVEKDDFGTLRLNGEYSLCRSLGDLYILNDSSSQTACAQVCGMSPRPTVSKITLCKTPSKPGQVAFEDAIAIVEHCDGLKEAKTLSSQQICSFFSNRSKLDQPWRAATSECVQRAVEGGSYDNCTLQLVDLRPLRDLTFRQTWYSSLQPHFSFKGANIFQGFF